MENLLKTKALVEERKGEKMTAIASEEVEDRMNEILSMDGWDLDNYKRNPVLLWSHDPKEPAVGKANNIRMGSWDGKKRLLFEPEFHGQTPLSDALRKLYINSFLNAFSVGFLPKEQKDNVYTRQELLEISCVNVPALPTALVLGRAKSMGLDEKLVKSIISEKPYPNEHSCRLESPEKYDTCRRTERKHEGKTYNVLTCRRKEDHTKWEEQAYRYPKDTWSASEASSHCKEHGGSFEAAAGKLGQEIDCKKEIEKLKKTITDLESAFKKSQDQIKPPCGENKEQGRKSGEGISVKEKRQVLNIAYKALEYLLRHEK